MSLPIDVKGTRSGGLEPASSDQNPGPVDWFNHISVILHYLKGHRKQQDENDTVKLTYFLKKTAEAKISGIAKK